MQTVLPDEVRQVIGYAAADDTLYAIGRDSSAVYYMKSTDGGLTWTPIPPSEWQAAVITTNVTKVPLESADGPIFSTILSANPDQSGKIGPREAIMTM